MDEVIPLPADPSDSSHPLWASSGHRRLASALAVVLLSLLLLFALATAMSFQQARDEQIRLATNTAKLLELGINQSLKSVEVALLALAKRSITIDEQGSSWAELSDAVDNTLEFSPHIRQILVARGDEILFHGRYASAQSQRLDRSALGLRPRNPSGLNLGLQIGDPVMGRFLPLRATPPLTNHHHWILPVALTVDPAGANHPAAMTIYAALNPYFFRRHLQTVELGLHSGTRLLALDGIALISYPAEAIAWPTELTTLLGDALSQGKENGLLNLKSGAYPGRHIGFQLTARYPLAVLVLVDHRDTLAAWWQRNRPLLLSSALAAISLVLGGLWLVRAIQHRFALQAQARVLGQAIAQSATVMLITDPCGRVLLVNAAYTTLTGFQAQEVLGRCLPLQQPDEEGRLQPLSIPPERHHHWQGEAVTTTRGGDSLWIMLNVSPLRSNGGHIDGYCCTQMDISERKHIEAHLRIAATAFETEAGMMVTDAQNVILRVNRAFTEVTGYTPAEVVGKTPAILNSGRQTEDFYRELWNTLQQNHYWQGELWNRRQNGEIYPEWLAISAVTDRHGHITHYVANFTDISQRKAAEDEIQRLAFFDTLTGLPNRQLLLERLYHALAASAVDGHYGALLFIDLDDFKTLNDSHGHTRGDQLLTEVARRLQGHCQTTDKVFHLGGDEFVMLLESLGADDQKASHQAEQAAHRIIEHLRHPYCLAGHKHHSSASVGVHLFLGHEMEVDELLKRAGVALHHAKAAGRDTVGMFDPRMQIAVDKRSTLENALRQSLALNQLFLLLQPQVNHHHQVLGAEALLRWQHPELGAIPPSEFIPLAEKSGLILPIGYWLLGVACDYLRSWQHDPKLACLSLAVNVSATQFRQDDFIARVLEIVHHSGINPTRLKLELTESAMLHDMTETIQRMDALRSIGIGFAVDDFGTGHSSLAYLKTLPIKQLKIDQSFVRDLPGDDNSAAIVRTIIAMANSLALDVIAEGVETEAQAAFLSHHGCRSFQGYRYGYPMLEMDFRTLVLNARQVHSI